MTAHSGTELRSGRTDVPMASARPPRPGPVFRRRSGSGVRPSSTPAPKPAAFTGELPAAKPLQATPPGRAPAWSGQRPGLREPGAALPDLNPNRKYRSCDVDKRPWHCWPSCSPRAAPRGVRRAHLPEARASRARRAGLPPSGPRPRRRRGRARPQGAGRPPGPRSTERRGATAAAQGRQARTDRPWATRRGRPLPEPCPVMGFLRPQAFVGSGQSPLLPS